MVFCLLLLTGAAVIGSGSASAVADTAGAVPRIDYIIGDGPHDRPTKDASWQRFKTGQSLGFRDAPVWLRIRFDQEMPFERPWLVIRPIYIDRVEIYPLSGPREPLAVYGDTTELTHSIIPNAYSLPLSDELITRGMLIRLQSNNLLQPRVDVRAQSSLGVDVALFYGAVATALAATIVYLLWGLTALATAPTLLIRLFILRMSIYLVTLVVHTGLARSLMTGEGWLIQDVWHNTTALVYITVAQLFDFVVVRETARSKPSRVLLLLVILFAMAKFAAFFLGDISTALQLNNLSVLLILGLAMVLLWSAPHRRASIHGITPQSALIYFGLQWVPFALTLVSGALASASYAAWLELLFLVSAIVPGGFITYVLFRRQQRLVRQRDRLAARARALRLRSREEQRKRQETGQLLEMLSHEIRTPLASLRMAHRMNELDGDLIGRCINAISHTLRQVDRVEEIEHGDLSAKSSPVRLKRWVKEVAAERDIPINISGDDCVVETNADMLHIVVSNVLENAANYRQPGTAITASVVADRQNVALMIRNTVDAGHETDFTCVFEKYYRGVHSSNRSGTGLGLYIVKQLADRLGLGVEMQSVHGQVVLEIRFPCTSEAEKTVGQ